MNRIAPGVRIVALPSEWATAGTPVDLADRILAFTFEDSEKKADRVSIQLDNHDLALFEREELLGGALLEVSWGYPGNMAPARRVVVRRVRGFTTLEVEGQALSVLMNREVRTRQWEHRTRADVAREIASENGFKGELVDVQDSAEEVAVINQAAETDARFLRRLATQEGFQFYVDDTGFHFHKRRQEAAPTRVFTWLMDPGQGDVISVSLESDLARRAGKVTVKGRDPRTRTTIEASATSKTVQRPTLGEVIEVVDPETGSTALEHRNATESVHPTPASTAQQAEQEATARFKQAEESAVKLSLQVVGDPTLRAKTVVEVRGISARFSGKYYVTEVKHSLSSSGYMSELRLSRDGVGRVSALPDREQGGERNRHEVQKADELTQVEVVDPETGRTRIEFRR